MDVGLSIEVHCAGTDFGTVRRGPAGLMSGREFRLPHTEYIHWAGIILAPVRFFGIQPSRPTAHLPEGHTAVSRKISPGEGRLACN